MGIFSRLSDIVNSNINSILDRAEDPKKMIRLIIQEMEETLVEVRTSTARVIADKKSTLRKVEQMRQGAKQWEEKAKLALSKNREDLARAALLEKQSIEEELAGVDKHFDRRMDRIEGELEAMDMVESKTLEQEIDDLADNDKINEELARLKDAIKS